MTDLRRMFYNRYKTSNIFNSDIPPSKPSTNNLSKGILPKQDTFIPKYNKMTSKERYWHEMRYKEFGQSNKENNNLNSIKSSKSNNNSPTKSTKRSNSIRETRKKNDYERKQSMNGAEIMCRDMYSGYDPKKYSIKRSKSLFDIHSTISNYDLNEKSSRQERSLHYNCSNIFFDKSKDIQIQKSFNKYKKNKSSTNINKSTLSKSLKRQKSMNDFERELNERKRRFSHSRFTTDMDWKTTNTEDMHYDTESNCGSVSTDSGVKKNNFRRVNIFKREMTNDFKNKNKNYREAHKESVEYNLLSGKDKKNEISSKVYNNCENDQPKKNYSKKKYDYKNNKNFQSSIEYYEIDIPKNYDLTDINTIRNYFTNKGLHAFKIEEAASSYTNQSGKITLRIRKDNVVDEKEYNKNINSVKKLMSKNDMKLSKVEGNKAKASTMAKQRVKTPFKGELMLRPTDPKKTNKNKNNKIETISKKCPNTNSIKNTKRIGNKTPGKRNSKANVKPKK